MAASPTAHSAHTDLEWSSKVSSLSPASSHAHFLVVAGGDQQASRRGSGGAGELGVAAQGGE